MPSDTHPAKPGVTQEPKVFSGPMELVRTGFRADGTQFFDFYADSSLMNKAIIAYYNLEGHFKDDSSVK